jgi:hypothetical protein
MKLNLSAEIKPTKYISGDISAQYYSLASIEHLSLPIIIVCECLLEFEFHFLDAQCNHDSWARQFTEKHDIH